MLTSITLKDYTTFINTTTFDFKATNYKILEETNVGSNRILKGALFVGENASGKTQVLKSIILLLNLLLENSEQNYLIKKSMYTKGIKYNLIYTFCIKNTNVKYEIGFNGNNIDLEKLYLNDELKLERLKDNGIIYFDKQKEIENINPQLSLLKQEYYNTRCNNNSIINELFEFLKNSIYINCLKGKMKSYNPAKISEQVIYKYAEAKDASKLNEFINKLGYNSEIVFNKQTTNKDKTIVIDSDNESIGIKKKNTDLVMPLPMESTGNQVFVNMILPINYATKNNCMIIVDEFSSGLHNDLEEALIKFFFNNSKDSQLFFTSHSTHLLDTWLMRPDQIYSFKFDSKEGTLVKRFSDENPRESQNIEKMYLSGVFDGMPQYNKEFKD